jgi:hypothetical protein
LRGWGREVVEMKQKLVAFFVVVKSEFHDRGVNSRDKTKKT